MVEVETINRIGNLNSRRLYCFLFTLALGVVFLLCRRALQRPGGRCAVMTWAKNDQTPDPPAVSIIV